MNFEPTTKARPIENLLNQINNRTEKIKSSACVSCDTTEVTFKDTLSEKEYTISGMCQTCQDNFFGV